MLKFIASFFVYFIEVTLSTFALGVALGFSRSFSFVASLWLAFLLFPPFNFVYGLQGWLATTPSYGHTLTLSNLIVIALLKIGVTSPEDLGFLRRLAFNWLLATCIFLLVLLIVLAAPFFNGGMLIGTFLLAGVIFLASTSYQQALWRAAAGAYVLACCAALHFFEFYTGARASSARFSSAEIALLQLRGAADLSSNALATARELLCGAGIFCDRLSNWPGALTGSYWLHVAIVLGGIAVALRMPAPLARIGALFSALWVVLLACLDRWKLRARPAASVFAALFFPDDVSLLGVFQFVCRGHPCRDSCPASALYRSRVDFCRSLRGGTCAPSFISCVSFSRSQVAQPPRPRRNANY